MRARRPVVSQFEFFLAFLAASTFSKACLNWSDFILADHLVKAQNANAALLSSTVHTPVTVA